MANLFENWTNRLYDSIASRLAPLINDRMGTGYNILFF